MEKHRVCIVDDDDDDLENLQDAFVMADCTEEILLYHSVTELFEELKGNRLKPDLIVLDHQAPGMNGAEALRWLRADAAYDKTALGIYSSHITSAKVVELQNMGADLCFAKGLTMQAMKQHAQLFCEAAAKRKGNV